MVLAVYHLVSNLKHNLDKSIQRLISQLIIVSDLLDDLKCKYWIFKQNNEFFIDSKLLEHV